MSEAEIQRSIVEWAREHPDRVPCLFRVNCGVFRSMTGNIVHGAPKGTPDLIGYLPDGRMLAVEVKTFKGRFSPEQIEWRRKALESNVKVIGARSLGEFVAALE